MKKALVGIWNYWKPLWEGVDGKPSLRSAGAIALLIGIIAQSGRVFYKWDAGQSLEGAALVLGVLMGGMLAMLGIQSWQGIAQQKIDKGLPNSPIQVENVKTINVDNKKSAANETVPSEIGVEQSGG